MKNLVTAIAVGVMYAGLISCNNTDGIDAAQSKFAVCDDGVKVHYNQAKAIWQWCLFMDSGAICALGLSNSMP